ncbi:hypothetical protein SAMN04487948_111127 [Halogranum amylolyticum]|uniref:DUF35 domain-containing protein n=1 Tax=Halogranum amylolyticum TaxID=660520 RepID=A0A1H8UM25_9EURY|nr:hypothetical protein [Halogranum amylolyticum]SEP03934.1 hypothetical protein SAMN04487948_111127 [Halogranum amylolyticum]
MTDSQNAGYDDLLDAVDLNQGYYLVCESGHGSFPPRQVCPKCGSTHLVEKPLPDTGTISTYTEIQVPTAEFAEETPIVAIADFGPVQLTGRVLAEGNDVAIGVRVSPTVTTSQAGERHLAFDLPTRR